MIVIVCNVKRNIIINEVPDKQYGLRSDYLERVVDNKSQVQDGVGPGGRGQRHRHAGLRAERFREFRHRVERQDCIEGLGVGR